MNSYSFFRPLQNGKIRVVRASFGGQKMIKLQSRPLTSREKAKLIEFWADDTDRNSQIVCSRPNPNEP